MLGKSMIQECGCSTIIGEAAQRSLSNNAVVSALFLTVSLAMVQGSAPYARAHMTTTSDCYRNGTWCLLHAPPSCL
jgi:hypothetical protein